MGLLHSICILFVDKACAFVQLLHVLIPMLIHATPTGAGDDVVRFWDVRKATTQVSSIRPLSSNVDELQGAPMLAATDRGEGNEPHRQYGVTSITEDPYGTCMILFVSQG